MMSFHTTAIIASYLEKAFDRFLQDEMETALLETLSIVQTVRFMNVRLHAGLLSILIGTFVNF
jgi:hypothetical protein